MKKLIHPTLILLFLALVMFTIPISFAQTGGDYDLSWSTINGGGTSNGGEFSLSGVIGQSDAGNLSGGEFSLSGGFLFGLALEGEAGSRIYLPLVLK